MKFTPEKYNLPDVPNRNFLDPAEIMAFLDQAKPTEDNVRAIIHKSLAKNRLSLSEVAVLAKAEDPAVIEMIKDAARTLKKNIYGNRIVLFAPLYIGNYCSNDCVYCGFRSSNIEARRKTLNHDELLANVRALEDAGQKRLILVFGEHRNYSPGFIAQTVRKVYDVKSGPGEIRRVNINAAPLETEGFRIVAESGIGTYQIFQETYHPGAYSRYHPSGRKADYLYRLLAFDRAMDAGIDDVGLGALFGLYDWRFEVMSLVRHTNHLEACYNVGPHTISFPRLQEASCFELDSKHHVNDEEFVRIISILRLAVPYTGLILTAREPAEVRSEVLQMGVSQIDAGTKIEIGAYAGSANEPQDLNREQFRIHDERSLPEVMDELIGQGYLPSFCTACYRKGRTGEHFMEFSVPGFIKRFCTKNAMLTLAEYLEDYASADTKARGWDLIARELSAFEKEQDYEDLRNRLIRVKCGERDLNY